MPAEVGIKYAVRILALPNLLSWSFLKRQILTERDQEPCSKFARGRLSAYSSGQNVTRNNPSATKADAGFTGMTRTVQAVRVFKISVSRASKRHRRLCQDGYDGINNRIRDFKYRLLCLLAKQVGISCEMISLLMSMPAMSNSRLRS